MKVAETIENSSYTKAFEELSNFLQGFGVVFGFVTKDVDSKREILVQHGQNREKHGRSLQELVQYEIDNNLTSKADGKLKSYCRTLLRLHRAMEFVALLLERLADASPTDSASTLCSQAYSETLSKYHGFIIRNSVGVAFYTMGSCEKLLGVAFGDEAKEPSLLTSIADILSQTHAIVESLLDANDLHNIP